VAKVSSYNLLGQRSDVVASGETHVLPPRVGGGPCLRDEWTPRVWKAFHRELLIELVDRGSATVDELGWRQLSVLELPLDRTELIAVVESARRHGLVKPHESAARADGSTPEEIVRASPSTSWPSSPFSCTASCRERGAIDARSQGSGHDTPSSCRTSTGTLPCGPPSRA